MRDWLDPLARFETETDDDNILIKVQFDDDALGEAFRQEFGRE
jgi:hypothetical protein